MKKILRKIMGVLVALQLLILSAMMPIVSVSAEEGAQEKKKVDIAFLIDTTGSMEDAIEGVKNSVAEFAAYFEEQGCDLRMSVIEYRDIAEDGADSTIVHVYNHTPWHTSTEQLVQTLADLSTDGGGDEEETPLDALGYLVNESDDKETSIKWSSDAYKFAFLLTDAGYKTDNNFGYESMYQMISALKTKSIATSVITSHSNYAAYRNLVFATGGQLANINSSDYVSSLKELADKALSLTLAPEKVELTVNAYVNDEVKENVSEATVSVFVDDKVKYYTTDENGTVTIPLSDFTTSQINRATISAHKSWTGTVASSDHRYPLISKFGTDSSKNGEAERYIYELHSEEIDANGNWCGRSFSDVIKRGQTEFTLSEPRLRVNLSVCYLEELSDASDRQKNKEIVQSFMSNLSQTIAQSTDGHVMINKVLIGNTTKRTDFYLKQSKSDAATEQVSADYNSARLASMADIRIEASAKEDVRIHSNAYIFGFFTDSTAWCIDDLLDGYFQNFKDISDEEIISLNGKLEFRRIQESWNAAESNYTLEKDMHITTTHESGHYIMGFCDEYLNGKKEEWGENRPKGAPKNFGLMDRQYDDVELSIGDNYRYLGSDRSKEKNTMQSFHRKASCEDYLEKILGAGDEDANMNMNLSGYVAHYTHSPSDSRRRGEYSYALVDADSFIPFDGRKKAVESSVKTKNRKQVPEDGENERLYEKAKVSEKSIAEFHIDGTGKVIINPVYTESKYYLYTQDENSETVVPIELAKNAEGMYSGKIDVSEMNVYECFLVVERADGYVMNNYQVECTGDARGYIYRSLGGGVMSYILSDDTCAYIFVANETEINNGDLISLNEVTDIISSDAAVESRGELYSVANVNSDINYETISWYRYTGGEWVKLDTDLSFEENMNIGARCDYSGDGRYVLMAERAKTDEMKMVTDLKCSIAADREGVIYLDFNDENENTSFYNIYYSDHEFTAADEKNVEMVKQYAGSEYYTINIGERNKDVYIAVVAVAEDGSKSPLSNVVFINTGEADRDGDGIPDWYCNKYLLWPVSGEKKDIANSDDDNDGLTNLEEYLGGSNPKDAGDPEKVENIAVDSIELNEKSINIQSGGKGVLEVRLNPNNATNQSVQWYVDDESKIKIQPDGLKCVITAVSQGTTQITVVTMDGGYTASCNITVTANNSSGNVGSVFPNWVFSPQPSVTPNPTITPKPEATPIIIPTEKPVQTVTPIVSPTEIPKPTNSSNIDKNTISSKGKMRKGSKITDKKTKAVYKITSLGKNRTVEYVKSINKTAASISISSIVKLKGKNFKVTSIGKSAFKNNKKLKKVRFGKNIKLIGSQAFSGCKKLKSVTAGSNVTAIGADAFSRCTSLTLITIPSKVRKIGTKAFYKCKNLRYIMLRTKKLTLNNVGKDAFSGGYHSPRVKTGKTVWKQYSAILFQRGISKKALFIINPVKLII